ncbi:MAG: hypothetical protein IJK02_03665 [Clostridia bacterium]|nr:hypothetical protein [Clostridia bacterium]
MKKALSVLLTVLLLSAMLAPAALAGTTSGSGSFTALCFNVAGLPSFGYLTGGETTSVVANQGTIGRFVEAGQYDIFATQEDFGYHDNLVSFLKSYPYQTQHHGGVPYGDGTNIFTRNMPMYNETHTVWDQLYGIADDGADQFSQKGITYCCIEVQPGIYIDFYDIHADAYGDEGSVAARRDNFRQLAEMINARTIDRPVIVTGDFNAFLFNDSSALKETLVDGAGLKDAWVEVCNGGNYDDCSAYLSEYGTSWTGKWGVWDSVERFMYKDGGGVTLECTAFEYIWVKTDAGKDVSDHAAASAAFSYSGTMTTPDDASFEKSGSGSTFMEVFRRIVTFFKALFMGLSNIDKVIAYFKK